MQSSERRGHAGPAHYSSDRMDNQALVTQMRRWDLWPEDPRVQAEIVRLQQAYPDVRKFGRALLQRNLLTPYQANQLLNGKGQSLVMGPYRILERLGEGGMCLVFKARHARLHKLVALKVIRKALAPDPQAVERFLREMQAVARLSHPNVVLAYDADRAAEGYYITMQYLDGVNLARLVQDEGLLPVARACSYVVQAALGLQHIHEHALVHRDVKPSNLMVLPPGGGEAAQDSLLAPSLRQWGQVKVLDLGLARLVEARDGEDAGGLTRVGTVMGTSDYMAPEQALHSSRADIRSDLYSLGCAFYYALTGRPPFPGGTPMEKMLRHQMEAPPPVGTFRPDVPGPVLAVLTRLMAKHPQDRYATPVEAAAALQDAVERVAAPAPVTVPALPVVGSEPTPYPHVTVADAPLFPPAQTVHLSGGDFAFDDGEPGAFVTARVRPFHASRQEWGLWALVACVVVAGMISLFVALLVMFR